MAGPQLFLADGLKSRGGNVVDDSLAAFHNQFKAVLVPEDAYVPHRVAGDEMDPAPPVTIGWETVPEPGVQAMLNLNDEIPEWFSRLERVAEIINQHQDVLRTKRACWKTYKDRGYRVEAHKLGQ